ncbi:hypothetical protein Q8A67_018428 [Cirrhinus molitorella]|uniref:Uncharacterized protein n=1 Tax=Cirrhinus molitorella TaxID=172907 RepID=A0AA88TQR0_9TELE|nr:hypothetical protein Q8A67_018428 [Cirrhinus molitorella]
MRHPIRVKSHFSARWKRLISILNPSPVPSGYSGPVIKRMAIITRLSILFWITLRKTTLPHHFIGILGCSDKLRHSPPNEGLANVANTTDARAENSDHNATRRRHLEPKKD